MDTPWVCRSLTEPLHDNAASMAVGYQTKKFLNFGGGRTSRGRFCAIARVHGSNRPSRISHRTSNPVLLIPSVLRISRR